ncbi:DUF4834 family protein [Chryseosolibacter indicus]|uniref:DUF4834 domain-containing protein n=1 Tax=Chryseosolibacter indicus TaxID=2782351 RepID=A0ABS5VTM2_9BACT|nr:DUF4834 family protein [Chryseosolibacter indicus]MBT1704408.1 hypothetical protein [Chryseosolibacter indicus]
MLKFLLILGLVLYSIYKIGNLFFRAGAASQQFRNQQRPDSSNLNGQKSKKSSFKGGEYVDYEEVK